MAEQDPVKYFQSDVKRLNYYNSQFLVDKDFNDEQLYHKQMRRLHNRALHTWGVVEGLEVRRVENENKVTVSPGIAIDRLGQEIVLTKQQEALSLDGYAADTLVFVIIRYRDVTDQADKDTSDTQTDGERYKRWTERPEVSASATDPGPDAPEVLLAVVKLDKNGAIGEVSSSRRRYAGSRIGSGADGGEYGIYADADGAWHFFDGGRSADRLTIDGRGRVGVGTPAPASSLSIGGAGDRFNRGPKTWDRPDQLIFDSYADESDGFNRLYDIAAIGNTNGVAGGSSIRLITNPVNSNTGVERLRIDPGGNVGIGTPTPAARLDVRGHLVLDPGGSPNLFTGTGGSELNRYLQLLNSPAQSTASGLKVGGVLVSDDYGYANPAKNDVVVKGRVSVGTAAASDYKLDVAGSIRSSTGGFVFPDGTTQATAADSARIPAKNVAAGTFGESVGGGNYTFPASVYWGDSASRTETKNDAGAIASKSGFFQTSAPTNYYAGASGWQHLIEARHSNNDNNFALQIAGGFHDQKLYTRKTSNDGAAKWSRFVLMNADGKVGIGTENPLGPLSIGDSSVAGSDGFIVIGKKTEAGGTRHFRLGFDANFNFVIGDYGHSNTAGTWAPQVAINYAAPANSLYINSGGNVGIGTSRPLSRVSISNVKQQANSPNQEVGQLTFVGFDRSVASAAILAQSPNWDDQSHLIFKTSNSGAGAQERMRIRSDGNVGIGAPDPGSKLEVAGDVKVTGKVVIGDWTLESRVDGGWGSQRSALFISYQGMDVARFGTYQDMLQIKRFSNSTGKPTGAYFYVNVSGPGNT